MRYKQRIIKHNIDVPKNIPSDKIKLTEIEYDPSVISHHPKSFEYYFTHGILINDERYIIKEFYVKNEDVYAVVTKDEVKYFELRMNYCSKAVLDKIIADLDKVKNAVENNAPVLNGRTLTINGSSVELPNDLQELSLNGNKLSLSKGNSVELPEYKNTAYDDTEVKNRLSVLESKKDNDTIYDDTNLRNRVASLESKRDNDNQTLTLDGRTISISGGNSITLPEDRDTVYNDSDLKRRITELEGKTDNFVSSVGISRNGNMIKLTYTFVDGTIKETEFEDKDTVTLAYDDTALKARVKALEDKPDRDNQSLTFNGTTGEISISNGNTVTIPSGKQTISKQGNKLILSNGGGEVDLPQPNNAVAYDDKPLRDRVTALEGRRDNDNQTITLNDRTLSISNGNSVTLPSDKQTISRQGNKLVLSNGGGEIDLPTPKDSVPYDDTALRNRVKALEDRPDRDNQTLTLEGNKLKLANGGEVNLDKFNSPTLRLYTDNIISSAIPGATAIVSSVNIANSDGIKPGDIVQDIISYSSGGSETNYWKVTGVNGNSVNLVCLLSDSIPGYNDGELRSKINALENKPAPAKQKLSLSGNTLSLTDGGSVTLPDNNQPVHRFYNGDIPGSGNPDDIKTVSKNNFRNPDGIKVGDTLEDFWSDNNFISRGIWKVLEVNGDNVKVQGIGGYTTNNRKNLNFNANTRYLSIDGGNNVTLPNDKQTISKNGNKIVLSNGGGEVDIPTATPYNDTDIKRRLGVLEAKPDNDKQTLSISGNTLSISNGNSVNIPQPNLSGYVPIDEYNKLKGALEKLLTDLKGSGAWRQTGSTVFEGSLNPNRHLATGNINLFGGSTDGSSFIRTNNGSTENDLAGGI